MKCFFVPVSLHYSELSVTRTDLLNFACVTSHGAMQLISMMLFLILMLFEREGLMWKLLHFIVEVY